MKIATSPSSPEYIDLLPSSNDATRREYGASSRHDSVDTAFIENVIFMFVQSYIYLNYVIKAV